MVNWLRTTGAVASSAAVFVSGSDYSKVVSFIQGPATEAIAKHLLADLIEHLGYLNENGLHESVTLGGNETLEKYVFLPGGDVYGMWGLEVPIRIMSLYTENGVAKATVF